MMVIALTLALALMLSLFSPAIQVANAMSAGRIFVWLRNQIVGELIWNGVKWVANEALKLAIAHPGVAAAIATAAIVAGILYFVFFSPTHTLPTPYNAQNAYWDYNNGYWVYPTFAMDAKPVFLHRKTLGVA